MTTHANHTLGIPTGDRHFSINPVTPPTEEPVSLLEAKQHLRITHFDEDAKINMLIIAARQFVENDLRRTIMATTLNLTLDEFPRSTDAIELILPPARSVLSIRYFDTDEIQQTLSNTLYLQDVLSEPGRVTPIIGEVWPSTSERINAVQVDYIAGHAAPSDVPVPIKQAILLLLSHWFEHRESVIDGPLPDVLKQAYDSIVLRFGSRQAR